jgi:hypothetical protein
VLSALFCMNGVGGALGTACHGPTDSGSARNKTEVTALNMSKARASSRGLIPLDFQLACTVGPNRAG